MKDNATQRERIRNAEIARQLFDERWSWLVDEYRNTQEKIRKATGVQKVEAAKIRADLKPFPMTASGMIGWLSTRPSCALQIYGPDIPKTKPLPAIYKVTELCKEFSEDLEYGD